MTPDAWKRLLDVLSPNPTLAVAVSGGVDSLTLATAAHRLLGPRTVMYHAVSPAVPQEATRRTGALAKQQGWTLRVFDAGEFADDSYRRNPVNRCFFCKTNLYGAIASQTQAQIVSGTNLDDLGEYRPGLDAARRHAVRHPFVEAEIDKAGLRTLAKWLGLGSLATLPSSPCLSSRVETGIAIHPEILAMIEAAEIMLRERLRPMTVRCRVRASGMVVELDPQTLNRLDADAIDSLRVGLAPMAAAIGFRGAVSFAPYRIGSAFLTGAAV